MRRFVSALQARGVKPWLFAVPLGYVLLSFWMMAVRGPYDLGLNLDPEYQYLFNCTRLATGHLSVYVHHPGTPLQIVGAGVIVVKWLLGGFVSGWPPLTEAVFADHLGYLRAINHTLVGMLFVVVSLAGWQVHRLSGSALATLTVQLTPALYMTPLEALPRVAPELPEVIAGMLLATALAPLVFGPGTRKAAATPLIAVAAGVALGIGIASKANFFSLLLLVFLFPGVRQKLRFLAGVLATFVVLLAPVALSLRPMYDWFFGMATHTGHYGVGEEGLPAWQEYVVTLGRVFENEPFLPYLLCYYVVVLVAMLVMAREGQYSGALRLLGIGTAAIVFHSLITAKHFNYHYVVPALMLTVPIHGALVWMLGSVRLDRRVKIALIAAGLLLGYEAGRSNWFRMHWYQGWKAEYHRQIAAVEEVRSGLTDCRAVGYFRSSLPTFALSLGNAMSALPDPEALERVYPGQVHINGTTLLHWDSRPAAEALSREAASGCVILQGEAGNPPKLPGFTLQPVYTPEKQIHGAEGIFRLRPDDSNTGTE